MQDPTEVLAAALGGRYQIRRELGRGGMATVYLASDLRHGRDVALKVLREDIGLGAERFLREIRVVAGLRHPHILPLHDSGEAGGLLFYVMPYVPGLSLQDWLAQAKALAARDALLIAAEVAEALDHAHRHGVVHRDIKPGNILLEENHAVVTDFGIARALREAGDDRTTQAGIAIGTPAYMSPEQITGEHVIDGRSDIYSLGCVLFEMLAGKPPFRGANSAATMGARLVSPPPRPSSVTDAVTEEIDTAVLRALAVDPADRYTTASDMAAALRAIATTPQVNAHAPAGGPSAASIAVLPFTNMSGDADNEYFADGISEEIINALAKLGHLRVASRTSAFAYKGQDSDIRRIGDQLNVAHVLEGSVRRAGRRLRVAAQLISVRDGYHIWSERFDRDFDDVFAIQDEIAQAIVTNLEVKLGRRSDARIVKPSTENLKAYNLFLEGRYHWIRRGESLIHAERCLSEAVELDPAFALAHSSLADTRNLLGWYRMRAPADVFPLAKASAERAIALDADLAEAYTSLGFALMCYDRDADAAERAFSTSLSLNPAYPTAHHWYAELLMSQGRTQEAVAEARKAQELDPLGLIINTVRGMAHYFDRDFAASVTECRRTLAMDQAFGPVMIWLGLSHIGLGEYAEAVRVFEEEQRVSGVAAATRAFQGVALARAGRSADAERVLTELRERATRQYVSAFDIALLEYELGNMVPARDELRRAVDERSVWLVWAAADPLLDTMRRDARLGHLLGGRGAS
jgi:TolB-like protein/tetratricopeptide (TPR) repeat protein/predicted Ser/Thr protein kinase